jgi:hypothetical protein
MASFSPRVVRFCTIHFYTTRNLGGSAFSILLLLYMMSFNIHDTFKWFCCAVFLHDVSKQSPCFVSLGCHLSAWEQWQFLSYSRAGVNRALMVHGANVARELRARPDFEGAECRIWCKLQTEIPRCTLMACNSLVSCRLYSHAYFVYRYF